MESTEKRYTYQTYTNITESELNEATEEESNRLDTRDAALLRHIVKTEKEIEKKRRDKEDIEVKEFLKKSDAVKEALYGDTWGKEIDEESKEKLINSNKFLTDNIVFVGKTKTRSDVTSSQPSLIIKKRKIESAENDNLLKEESQLTTQKTETTNQSAILGLFSQYDDDNNDSS